MKFAIRALTTEEATDRKNQGSGGIAPPEPCAFSASLWVCFHGGNLLLHFPNQLGQFFLTFLLGTGVDVAGHAFSADGGGVAAFPEVVVDLADTAGAGLAALALVGLEGGGRRDSWRRVNLLGGFTFGDPTVDLSGGSPLHLARHMGVDIQGSAAGHMADDGRKGLDVHTVLQGSGGKGVA